MTMILLATQPSPILLVTEQAPSLFPLRAMSLPSNYQFMLLVWEKPGIGSGLSLPRKTHPTQTELMKVKDGKLLELL